MRTTGLAATVAGLAVVGLVVSLSAAWSSLGSEATVSDAGRGPHLAFEAPGGPPRVTPETPPPTRPRPAKEIGRSDASVLRSRSGTHSSHPVRVTVGSIDIDARVRPVGVAPDGQMQLPRDPAVLGWYKYGARPDGPVGATVLAGHLDSRRFGLGPLVRLREARVGDTVRVAMSNGERTTYRVVRIARFDRQGLPAQLFTRSGPPRLRLITCGGGYDADDGGYQQNLVVTAAPIAR